MTVVPPAHRLARSLLAVVTVAALVTLVVVAQRTGLLPAFWHRFTGDWARATEWPPW